MVNALVKYITPKTKTPTIPIASPGEPTNPLLKYITGKKEVAPTTPTTSTTNPLLKYISKSIAPTVTTAQKPEEYGIMSPKGYEWMATPAQADVEWAKLSGWGKIGLEFKRALKDVGVSVPMVGAGLVQWPVQAHRQAVSEGMKFPTPSGEKTVISPKYTQPQGIGYIPTMLWNMVFRPGVETIRQMAKPKELLASYRQHPLLGPLGSAVSLALPLLLAKGAVPRAKVFPLAPKEGLPSPLVPPEPSLPSKLVGKAWKKFKESPRMLRFKEITGLLPEQIEYFNLRHAYELERANMLSKAGRGELYQTLKKFTPAEKQSFILNLEMAKPATPASATLLKKAKITIPKTTVNVTKALDLWKASSEEGLAYMMKATEGTLYKGGLRGKLLTKSTLARGRAEFKVPLIKEAKNFRAKVKKLGGISEKSAKPYADMIPKDLIKKNGLPLEEIANRFNITVPDVVSKLRKFSEMKGKFTDLAVEKMTKKFGYKVPIGTKPGMPRGGFIEEARWQPTIQALEAKLGTKFTIAELRDLGFGEPSYYHHVFPREYQYRTRAYTGPTYKPGIWKERMGAKGYTREPLVSVRDYDWQMTKYKALNQFKDYVFDKFGKRLNPENPMQAIELRKGNIVKYGKGKVLYETPQGAQIKVKASAVLPRTIANEFNKMFLDTSRGEMGFRTYFDPVTNTWRVGVLATPRWVFNNIVGNFTLNTMGGVGLGGYLDSIGATVKAAKMMIAAKKAGSPITYVDALIKLGVPERAAQGLYRGEFGVSLRELSATGTKMQQAVAIRGMQKAGAALKYVPNKIFQFNSAVESFFRTAHYFDKVGKGFDIKLATASVNEFLFDYTALSKTQKAIFRRIDPFWNWHKNIIRLAVSYPIKYPQRFMLLSYANKLGTEAYDDKLRAAGVNPDNIPEYYKNMFLLPWKDKEGKDFYISLRGIDPLQDVMLGIHTTHPLVQLIYERSSGQQAFTLKPFTSPYTAYGRYEKVTPAMWRLIMNKFPYLRLIEDVSRPYSIYDTGEPMLTKWGEPVYTKNRLLTVLAIFGFKVTPRDIDEIYRRSREEARAKEKRKTKYEQRLKLYEQRQEYK